MTRASRSGDQTSASTASIIQYPDSGWRPGRHRASCEWTDWSSGPPAHVVLSCGHEHDFKPPSPAKGDLVTCGTCGTAAVVVKPVRRLDRHAPPLAPEDVRPALDPVVYVVLANGKGLRLHRPSALPKRRR